MEQIYQWCMAHQAIMAIAASLLTFAIGWALPNDRIMKAGFFVSQFIRRVAGKKLEEKIEQAVDSFDKGMKGDS